MLPNVWRTRSNPSLNVLVSAANTWTMILSRRKTSPSGPLHSPNPTYLLWKPPCHTPRSRRSNLPMMLLHRRPLEASSANVNSTRSSDAERTNSNAITRNSSTTLLAVAQVVRVLRQHLSRQRSSRRSRKNPTATATATAPPTTFLLNVLAATMTPKWSPSSKECLLRRNRA